MEKLVLVFRDSNKILENFELSWNILDTNLSRAWLKLLKKNIFTSSHPIEKTFCLKGWQTDWHNQTGRNLTYLCQQLNKHITVINADMVQHGYPYIDLYFSVEKLKGKEYSDLMNSIHHHFELLIGQVWNVSKWYSLAQETTRFSIRMLNNYCHEIESIVRGIKDHSYIKLISFLDVHSSLGVSVSLNGPNFDGNYFISKITEDISIKQYNDFQNYWEWGDIRIFYSQLGKSHLESYTDNDQHIDKENISGYKYLTGEFCITFPGHRHKRYLPYGFKRWLKQNDYDVKDKTLGIEYPIVARIDVSKDVKIKTIADNLQKRDDLYQMRLEDENGNVLAIRTFDYYWTDQEPS